MGVRVGVEWVLSASKDFCSATVPEALTIALPICCALVFRSEGTFGVIGMIAGTGAVAGVCLLVDSDRLHDRVAADRIEPENADFSDSWSVLNFEMFTDEIEKRTMNSANMSVSMSA